MLFHKPIYILGVMVRNRQIFKCYEQLKECEKWSLAKLEERQLSLLSGLLNNAYLNSPYYREKFDASGFKPGDLKSLKDLASVPVTTKDEFLSNFQSIQIKNCGERLYFSETSGSTGKPLVFYRNQEWDAWHNASVLRGYSWHNVKPWEKNGYLWGYNIEPKKRIKVKFLDLLQNRFRLFSYKDDLVQNFVQELKSAQYLEGYSSMLYEIAKKVNHRQLSNEFSLKLVKGTSEKIYDTYQNEVVKAFGRKIVSEYGSAEGGIIAFECAGGNMHINMETVIVEVIDNEIVLTNLVSKSFPVIRYKLGDYVAIENGLKCSCGMAHPIIKEVTGRVGALIQGKTGTYPSLTLYYVFKNLALEKKLIYYYQVVQRVQGSIDLYIEKDVTENEKKLIQKEMDKYFGADLETTIISGQFRNEFDKKNKDFVSYL